MGRRAWQNQKFRINKFNYRAGDALELADGLSYGCQGEVVSGDSLQVKRTGEISSNVVAE